MGRQSPSIDLGNVGEVQIDFQTLGARSTDHDLPQLIDLETHREVFGWALGLLASRGLLKGKRLGVDATTLEASAAMRSIVRRDTGESYEQFLTGLAKASGIETPTREQLGTFRRKSRTLRKGMRGPGRIKFWFGTGGRSRGEEEREGSYSTVVAPMLMRLSLITPRPTHLFMPAVPL